MFVVCILTGYPTWCKHEPTSIRKWSFWDSVLCQQSAYCSGPTAMAGGTVNRIHKIHLLGSKMTKLLTDSEGLVPASGEYTTRYCCTGPGAGSQRTSRLFGVGLYTWTFLASPLATGEGKANAYFSSLFIHVELLLSLLQNLHSVKGSNTILFKLLIIYIQKQM